MRYVGELRDQAGVYPEEIGDDGTSDTTTGNKRRATNTVALVLSGALALAGCGTASAEAGSSNPGYTPQPATAPPPANAPQPVTAAPPETRPAKSPFACTDIRILPGPKEGWVTLTLVDAGGKPPGKTDSAYIGTLSDKKGTLVEGGSIDIKPKAGPFMVFGTSSPPPGFTEGPDGNFTVGGQQLDEMWAIGVPGATCARPLSQFD